MKLTNNLTFAILVTDGSWRTDLTHRFAQYYSHRINGDDFIKNIIFPNSVDDALEECNTDYLLVLQGGHVPFTKRFFDAIENVARQETDIFIGYMELMHDYVVVHPRCIFINKLLWKSAGKPAYASHDREGPFLKTLKEGADNRHPAILGVNSSEPRQFIPFDAASMGSSFVVRQLELYEQARSFSTILAPFDDYYISFETPYHEIHTETVFEKKFLNAVRSNVFAVDDADLSTLKDMRADLVVTPAQGLKPLLLANHLKAKTLVVFDKNPFALELQKMILSVDSPTLYGDIITTFQESFPEARVADDWEPDQYSVIHPLRDGITIEYRVVDLFSFEAEDLIKSFDHELTAVFDLGDIFVYPFNFYRRPLYQVQGLFAEVYSLIKSRVAPVHILGFAPGYQSMDAIEINTSRVQYEMRVPSEDDPVEEIVLEELPAAEVPTGEPKEVEEEKPEPPPIMFTPPTTAAPKEREQPAPQNWVKAVMPPKLGSPPPPNAPIIELARLAGYAKSMIQDDEGRPCVLLAKTEVFEEFDATFEYRVHEPTSTWSFKVGKTDNPKRIEFSNGVDRESFIKHLDMKLKINPKTAVKYFK
jgi:hypothetical protein